MNYFIKGFPKLLFHPVLFIIWLFKIPYRIVRWALNKIRVTPQPKLFLGVIYIIVKILAIVFSIWTVFLMILLMPLLIITTIFEYCQWLGGKNFGEFNEKSITHKIGDFIFFPSWFLLDFKYGENLFSVWNKVANIEPIDDFDLKYMWVYSKYLKEPILASYDKYTKMFSYFDIIHDVEYYAYAKRTDYNVYPKLPKGICLV